MSRRGSVGGAVIVTHMHQADLEASREVARPTLLFASYRFTGDPIPDHLHRLHIATQRLLHQDVHQRTGLLRRQLLAQRVQEWIPGTPARIPALASHKWHCYRPVLNGDAVSVVGSTSAWRVMRFAHGAGAVMLHWPRAA